MLTCVCRPVSGNLPKMSPSVLPAQKVPRTAMAISAGGQGHAAPTVVVTAEPKLNVPGRLTPAELRAMALRQQQQIDSQHQLLATKEQRLRFLKSQEVRSAVANAEGERLRRLRERVEAQESKLRRLRALRGQVDLQKTYNVTLSNDLDSIRAAFSEKEKELSVAVAKVEALTRQLEELRRDRRCPVNLAMAGNGNGNTQPLPAQTTHELEKLRRELMYRNQLSLQQDARLHLQREALQQRQAELRSVDQRIYELQSRLQRKKAANVQSAAQTQNHPLNVAPQILQQQQQPIKQQQHKPAICNNSSAAYHQSSHVKQGVTAFKQQLLQKQTAETQQPHSAAKFSNIMNRESNRSIPRGNVAAVEPYIHTPQKSTITPTAGYTGTGTGTGAGPGNILKHAAATANTNQQNQLIQDLAHVKLNLATSHSGAGSAHAPNTTTNFFSGESDESKLAKKMLTATLTANKAIEIVNQVDAESATHIYAEVGPKKRDLLKDAGGAVDTKGPYAPAAQTTNTVSTASNSNSTGNGNSTTSTSTGVSSNTTPGSKIPKSISANTSTAAMINKLNSAAAAITKERLEHERKHENVQITGSMSSDAHVEKQNQHQQQQQQQNLQQQHQQQKQQQQQQQQLTQMEKQNQQTQMHLEKLNQQQLQQQQQLTVHSMLLGVANRSLATAVPVTSTATISAAVTSSISSDTLLAKPKPLQPHAPASLAVPPRKPISSVAPTSVTNSSSSAIPKMITYSPRVNRVAPNVVDRKATAAPGTKTTATAERPALPPKPSKMSPTEAPVDAGSTIVATPITTLPITSALKKSTPPTTMALIVIGTSAPEPLMATSGLQTHNINDNLPIKAKPLTIRKQPMSEQPRLKSVSSLPKLPMQGARRNELQPPAGYKVDENANSPPSSASASPASASEATSPEQTPSYSSPEDAQQQHSPNSNSQSSSSTDELDKIERASDELPTLPEGIKRRAAGGTITMTCGSSALAAPSSGKPKLGRRVSFDPLALLLDASLEGELELVKKTTMQVPNPSAANDEGITALHNAICAGHFDIVRFLVEYGCDVNAQDSDGWTPLHCAASCNNLSMVKFLVDHGACLFAATLSDHETPAEKCEEDEEGFDGCSEYLYSIQEKLGILHGGEVYAVFSYDAQNSDELSFYVNECLVILRKGDDAESEWWWARNSKGVEGYVPRNLLGLFPRVPPQSSNFND